MTNDIFASTFTRTDGGLVYALSTEGTELFSAFVGRNPKRLLEIASEESIKLVGEWAKKYFDSEKVVDRNFLL